MRVHGIGFRAGLWVVSTGACAAPCVDDGVNQKFCPSQDTDTATDSASGSGSATAVSASADATATEPTAGSASMTASATAASASMTAADSGDASASATTTVGDECPLLDDAWQSEPPTFLLLIDQSGSMDQPFDTSTRWQVLGETLFDPTVGAIAQFEDQIRFGMSLYTNTDADPGCPELTETAPMLGAFDAISMAYEDAMPQQDTPTGDAITAVTAELVDDPAPGERVIVLVTDGEPDTCVMPNPQMGQAEAVAAATAAHDAGIRTVVVSVGSDVSADHLQDMANAGAGVSPGDPDEPYYVATNQAELSAAFEAIIFATRPCSFTLQQPLIENQAGNCVVQVNGTAVDLDDPDGWHTDGATKIELVGGACEAIQTGAGMVEMTCDCSAVEGA